LKLSDAEVKAVREIAVEADAIPGDRYDPKLMKILFVDTLELE
jgi:hypothetical protein